MLHKLGMRPKPRDYACLGLPGTPGPLEMEFLISLLLSQAGMQKLVVRLRPVRLGMLCAC